MNNIRLFDSDRRILWRDKSQEVTHCGPKLFSAVIGARKRVFARGRTPPDTPWQTLWGPSTKKANLSSEVSLTLRYHRRGSFRIRLSSDRFSLRTGSIRILKEVLSREFRIRAIILLGGCGDIWSQSCSKPRWQDWLDRCLSFSMVLNPLDASHWTVRHTIQCRWCRHGILKVVFDLTLTLDGWSQQILIASWIWILMR